MSLENIFSELN